MIQRHDWQGRDGWLLEGLGVTLVRRNVDEVKASGISNTEVEENDDRCAL
jgi:hypothetical protein